DCPKNIFWGGKYPQNARPEYFPGQRSEYFPTGGGIIRPCPNINIPDELAPPIDPDALLQPNNLCPASSSRLVKHGAGVRSAAHPGTSTTKKSQDRPDADQARRFDDLRRPQPTSESTRKQDSKKIQLLILVAKMNLVATDSQNL